MSLIYQGSKQIIKKVEICIKDNEPIKLGQGGQAIVYKGRMIIQQQDLFERQLDIALKRILLPKCKIARQRVYELIKREQSVYRSIKSPHIIKLFGTNLNIQNTKFDELDYLDFYFELCDGNLADLILDPETGKDLPLSEEMALQIFGQVVEVEFLLEMSTFLRSTGLKQGVFHRDLNVKNILYKNKKNKIDVKVCDFGIANYLQDEINATQNIGTKTFQCESSTLEKNEAWALGLLLFCLLRGLNFYKQHKPSFNNKNEHFSIIEKMELSVYTKDILKNLLHIEPEKRWGYVELRNSRWYTLFGSNKCKILQTIQPFLKFKQDCFHNLSLQLLEYDNLIHQNYSLLQEFKIPQDLLLITLKSYQQWSQRQLEKYSGSYCYEYHCISENLKQKELKNEILQYETHLVQITSDLRDFFLQVTGQLDKSSTNSQIKKIIEYWSQIINQKTNISHYQPDSLYYQLNLLEEIEQKLQCRLSIFKNQSQENSKQSNKKSNNNKNPGDIKDKINELQQLFAFFNKSYEEQKLKLNQQEMQLQQSSIQKFQSQISVKQQQQDNENITSDTIEKQREQVEELKYQISECLVTIKQKEKLLEIIEQKEKFEKALKSVKVIKDEFQLFFNWKRQKQYTEIFGVRE